MNLGFPFFNNVLRFIIEIDLHINYNLLFAFGASCIRIHKRNNLTTIKDNDTANTGLKEVIKKTQSKGDINIYGVKLKNQSNLN